MEKLLQAHGVELAQVDGRKLANLCHGDLDVSYKPSKEELFGCITN